MANKQVIASEAIAKAVAEETRVTMQAMGVAVAERPQSAAGPKISRPAMKQPTFYWEAEEKYSKLKTFRLELNNILVMYSTPQAEQLAMVKELVRQKRSTIYRIINTQRKRYVQHIRRPIQNSHQQV